MIDGKKVSVPYAQLTVDSMEETKEVILQLWGALSPFDQGVALRDVRGPFTAIEEFAVLTGAKPAGMGKWMTRFSGKVSTDSPSSPSTLPPTSIPLSHTLFTPPHRDVSSARGSWARSRSRRASSRRSTRPRRAL